MRTTNWLVVRIYVVRSVPCRLSVTEFCPFATDLPIHIMAMPFAKMGASARINSGITMFSKVSSPSVATVNDSMFLEI
jgi:hypothetical protein